MDQSASVELLGSRKVMYGFLRQIFLEGPTEEVLGLVRGCELSIGGGKLPTGSSDEHLRESLTREFNRLFIGPGRVPASLYESVYRSPSRLLMQESTVEVRRAYLEAGLVMQRLGSVPDDHLGAELEFMYYLSARAAAEAAHSRWEEADRYLTLGLAFLKGHLLSWVGEFSEDVLQATEDQFFRGLVMLLVEFLSEDLEFLQEVCGQGCGSSAFPGYSASAVVV